ncbi:hypothetical protein BT69DRAFT_1320159 [Atractiella rhizophila]|nr:hypothetical protein BT69DRAFT_1320159 [Atractiella rhizophila]
MASSSESQYAYKSSNFPLFYDLWTDNLFGNGPSEDSPIYNKLILSSIASKSGPIVAVDLATGTGRVVKQQTALLSTEDREKLLWKAIDHSASMVERAESTFNRLPSSEIEGTKVDWIVCEAEGLENVVSEADYLFFSAGSIAHIVTSEEVLMSLRAIGKVLSKGGRAIISTLKLEEDGAAASDGEADFGRAMELLIPDGEYADGKKRKFKKSKTNTDRSEGGVLKENFEIEMWEEDKKAWSEKVNWTLREWSEGELAKLVEQAGLDLVEKREGGIQWFWILRRKD